MNSLCIKKCKYVMFIGHRYGFALMNLIDGKNLDVVHVFIEREHQHETEQYYNKIEEVCCKLKIPCSDSRDIQKQIDIMQENNVDFVIVYGYRRIIKKEVYEKARYGAVAMHYSLLPKYRGFAPVNWALINGEIETGVSLFFLTESLDEGDIIEQSSVNIELSDDINSILVKCDADALKIIDRQFVLFERGIINRIQQDNSQASYACARSPADSVICWNDSTINIYNLIRAVTYPFSCAFTYFNGELLRIIDAEIITDEKIWIGRIPGKVVSRITGKGVEILTGDGVLLIKNVIDANENRVSADQLIKSVRIRLGA